MCKLSDFVIFCNTVFFLCFLFFKCVILEFLLFDLRVFMKKYALIILLFIMGHVFANEKNCDLYFSTGLVLRTVPVAVTQKAQAEGLSKRLQIGTGMLFAWHTSAQRFFWMHNTWVPLSIGYFDAKGRLFSIQDMEQNTDKIHSSIKPALLALELPRGGFAAYQLKIGDRILRFCDVDVYKISK